MTARECGPGLGAPLARNAVCGMLEVVVVFVGRPAPMAASAVDFRLALRSRPSGGFGDYRIPTFRAAAEDAANLGNASSGKLFSERWLSGRKRGFAKPVALHGARRFESCPLRWCSTALCKRLQGAVFIDADSKHWQSQARGGMVGRAVGEVHGVGSRLRA